MEFNLGDSRFGVRVISDTQHLEPRYGPRFDSTAYVEAAWLGDQQFLMAGTGLTDELGIAGVGVLGFEQAAVGGSFVKIGVGELERDSPGEYVFSRPYPVRRRWPIVARESGGREPSVVVEQASTPVNGFAYRYRKRYRLLPAEHGLAIEYELANTGGHAFAVEHYNHNWFQPGTPAIGPGITLETGFVVEAHTLTGPWLSRMATSCRVAHAVTEPSYLASNQPAPREQNRFTLRHDRGATVVVIGDRPVTRFALYAQPDAICPEVFVTLEIAAGAAAAWSNVYRFARDSA